MYQKMTVTAKDLTKQGFTKSTSQNIIRQAKASLVTEGISLYDNKRIGIVPIHAVEKIIGFKLSEMEDDLNG